VVLHRVQSRLFRYRWSLFGRWSPCWIQGSVGPTYRGGQQPNPSYCIRNISDGESFAVYQDTADSQMFAALVPAILLGAAAERSRMLPALIFIFCWTTVVYDPIAHWVWSANGWAFKWGVLDCKSPTYLHVQD
jgi:ammonia channel protein AmtB